MKVGEIIFHYSTGRELQEFYTSEKERSDYIRAYWDAQFYTIIPYEGTSTPNYINTELKAFRATLPLSKEKHWRRRYEVIK